MAAFNSGNWFGDSWVVSFEACETLGREVMEKIAFRNQQLRNSVAYNQANVQARQLIKRFIEGREKLVEKLMEQQDQLTEAEFERRERLLDNLWSKKLHMETAFDERDRGANRSSLLGTDLVNKPSNPWGVDETEETRDLTFEELKQKQKMAIEEQDSGLDTLYNVVVRQKNMAQNIGQELDIHHEIIDDITDHTDRTKERLIRETRHVRIVDRKSASCWYWVIIVLLLIAIVTVASVPKS